MSNTQALTVVSPLEVQQEEFALLVLTGDNGKGLSIAQAAEQLEVPVTTAHRWWRGKVCQDAVAEHLHRRRKESRLKADKLVDKAMDTLEKAMNSPAYTPTMVNAAKAILAHATGEASDQQAGVSIQVMVNTPLDISGMAATQERRYQKLHGSVIEGVAIEAPPAVD